MEWHLVLNKTMSGQYEVTKILDGIVVWGLILA